MKRQPEIIALLLVLCLLSACGSSPDDIPSPEPVAGSDVTLPGASPSPSEEEVTPAMPTVFTAETGSVKTLGRTYFNDGILWCALSGTGAEFTVSGANLSVTLAGDNMHNGENRARIAILVDGERVIDDMLDAPEKTYTVFEGEKEAVVTVIKLSESPHSTIGIKSIEVTGTIAPTPQKETLIEFIGDSITCGYGVDDEDRNHHFSTSTEDVTKAYAYIAASTLDADYSMVSFSGYGVISGYTSTGSLNDTQTVPRFYDKLGFSHGDGFPASDTAWDFSARQPDIIVVNLGTNDDSYCGGNKEREAEYTAGFTAFLKQIRALNPDAKIVCGLGIMGDRLYPAMERAVTYYVAETADANIECLRFDVQKESDGYAADWHPTFATHTKAADKLVGALTEGE